MKEIYLYRNNKEKAKARSICITYLKVSDFTLKVKKMCV